LGMQKRLCRNYPENENATELLTLLPRIKSREGKLE
jgi:hypothetical protein